MAQKLYFGIFGSASVPVMARNPAEAAEKLRKAGFGVTDRIALRRP